MPATRSIRPIDPVLGQVREALAAAGHDASLLAVDRDLTQTVRGADRQEAGSRLQPRRIVFRAERARVEHRGTAQPARSALHRIESVGSDAGRRQEHLDQDAAREWDQDAGFVDALSRRDGVGRQDGVSADRQTAAGRRLARHHRKVGGEGYPGAVRAARPHPHRVLVADSRRGVHRRSRVLRRRARQPAAAGAAGRRDGLHRIPGGQAAHRELGGQVGRRRGRAAAPSSPARSRSSPKTSTKHWSRK